MATKNGETNLGEVSRETAQTASDAVKSAKAVSKIAANAASGNAAGAVVEGVKAAPELLRTAARLIVAMLAVTLILTYAFPASIYEATSAFFEAVQEREDEYIYSGGGDVQVKTFLYYISLGPLRNALKEAASSIWSAIISQADSSDVITADGQQEVGVMENQDDLRDTSLNCILACSQKIKVRAEELEDIVTDMHDAIDSYFSAAYAGTYDRWDGTTVALQVEPMSYYNALQLLSVYSTTKTGDNEPLKVSGFMRWLGYYDSSHTDTVSFDLGKSGIIGSVNSWCGTFVPQYLTEQVSFERNNYGDDGIKTDLSDYSCALIDLMLVIDTPDFSTIPAEYGTDVIVTGVDEETGDDITEEIVTATVTVPIQIRVRNITELSNIIGFWGGNLDGDGTTTGESEMGNIFW